MFCSVNLLKCFRSKKIVLFLFLILSVFSNAQSKKWLTFKANRLLLNSQFDEGIDLYHKVLNKDSTYFKANLELAKTYYYLGSFDSSLVYFQKCINHPSKDTNYYSYYGYANSLRLLNQPKKALDNYQIFEDNYKFTKKKSDQELKIDLSIYKAYCKQSILKQHQADKDVLVTNIGARVNTPESEYGNVFLQNDSSFIYIGRYKDYRKEYQFEDDEYFENIYLYNYNLQKTQIYNEYDNQITHLAVVGVVNNSDSLLVYYKNTLWITNQNKVKELTPLPSELQGFYHQPSGVFTLDQNTLYFSARKDKKDDLDIYVSHKKDDGSWSTPVVVKELSSEYDDDSPFLSQNDTVMYFSSKGFNSSGDYDIFKSVFINQKWSEPVSLDYPINSSGDDIYFIINNSNKSFLSSNRVEGFGLMDIYEVQFPPKPTFDCGTFDNTNLTVELDVLNSVDPSSVKLKFHWIFDDNEELDGEKVTKTFAFPGEHKIIINVIDEESGMIEKNEVIENINIDSVNYVGFSYPNYLIVDSNSTFNANVSYIKDERITNYYWRVNDTILFSDTSKIDYFFTTKGNNKVDIQINTLDSSNIYHSYCYTKQFNVITFQEYNELKKDSSTINKIKEDDYYYSTDSLNQITNNDGAIIDTLYFEPIYFGFDKYYLTNKAKHKLDTLIDYLEEYPEVKIIVAGHTDSKGSNAYNISLSKRRIKSTLKYLMKHGLSEDRIYRTIGYGESKPAEPNTLPNGKDNAKGRKKNRRVEFIIFKGND